MHLQFFCSYHSNLLLKWYIVELLVDHKFIPTYSCWEYHIPQCLESSMYSDKDKLTRTHSPFELFRKHHFLYGIPGSGVSTRLSLSNFLILFKYINLIFPYLNSQANILENLQKEIHPKFPMSTLLGGIIQLFTLVVLCIIQHQTCLFACLDKLLWMCDRDHLHCHLHKVCG